MGKQGGGGEEGGRLKKEEPRRVEGKVEEPSMNGEAIKK